MNLGLLEKYYSEFVSESSQLRWTQMEWTSRLSRSIRATYFTRRFAMFLLFGGLAAVVNISVGAYLYGSPAIKAWAPYWLAVGAGAASGLLLNFALNYLFNFNYRGRSAYAQLATFTVVASGGVVLTAALAETFLRLGRLASLPEQFALWGVSFSDQWCAHVLSVALVTFYSFAAHSAFSFNEGLRRYLQALHPGQDRRS
jgi:putative flippase GtrA